MRIRSRFRVWFLALALAGPFSLPALGAGHSLTLDPIAAGPYPVACTDLAHDVSKQTLLGGSLDDYWSGDNGHYIGDILLEPGDTLKISPRIPDQDLYAGRRNTLVDFVLLVCYPTDSSNVRPDYVLPNGQVVPRMQRAGQAPILPSQPCIAIYPPPAGCGRWPLLAFAHGLDSSPADDYSIDFLTRFAAQGYIVAAAFHGDGRFLRLQLADLGDLFYLLRNFDAVVELQALRPLAVKSMIDAMLASPDFGNSIDAGRIGGIGVSLGGETMTLLLGAQLTDRITGDSSVQTVNDPRIKAAVGYIPYAGQKYLPAFGQDNATAANVGVPYLAISGIDDDVAPMYRMEEALNNFRSARYQVGLAGVAHEYAATYADDIFGWAIPFMNAYLDCSAPGRAGLERLLLQHSIRGGLDDQLLVSRDAPALCFAQGWNLLGNGADAAIDVSATFADSTRFQTVWKWLPAQNGWAFYSPSLAAQGGTSLADYAAAKGYRLLTSIAGGEGFWVHASQAGSVNTPGGNAVPVANLVKGWNLVAVGETATPQQFCNASGAEVTTLWAWDTTSSGWYFYAPKLAASGELANYIASRGYLDFSTANKTLGYGTGFWVNRP